MPEANRRKYLRYKTAELIEAGETFLKENNIKELKEIEYEINFRKRPYTARMLVDIKKKISLFLENNSKENKITTKSSPNNEIINLEDDSQENILPIKDEIELNNHYSSNERKLKEKDKN